MIRKHMRNQTGAVSIFVVVFSAMFVTIITVSYVSLMIRAQQQASNADLSNSAYDSALAGVEDAKRVLLQYRKCLNQTTPTATCSSLISLFSTPNCTMVKRALGDTSSGETLIKSETESATTGNSKSLDQAYTCVEISYTADEKELTLKDGESVLVPIDSAGKTFDSMKLSWYMQTRENTSYTQPSALVGTKLPLRSSWSASTPPILRTQLIQHGSSFNPSDFDADQAAAANTKTAFLYPTGGVGATTISAASFDYRPATGANTKAPFPVNCFATRFNNGLYACEATIRLPDPIGGSGTRSLYLNLQALYNDTKVKIELLNGGSAVNIVAPTIDSTGRANDLFRRVKVGVSFNGVYPKANFDINGNLCKNFSVTNDSFIEPNGCRVSNPNNE